MDPENLTPKQLEAIRELYALTERPCVEEKMRARAEAHNFISEGLMWNGDEHPEADVLDYTDV